MYGRISISSNLASNQALLCTVYLYKRTVSGSNKHVKVNFYTTQRVEADQIQYTNTRTQTEHCRVYTDIP